jgi:hypothetical protein
MKSKKTSTTITYKGLFLTDLLDAENVWLRLKNNYTAAILDYKLVEIK